MALADAVAYAVAHWTLDEASGSRADSIGSNTLDDNATVGSAAGKFGNAADFERDSSEYLSISDNAALSTGDVQYMLRFWMKLESGGIVQVPVSKWDYTSNNREFSFAVDASNIISFTVSGTGSSPYGAANASTFGALSTGVWYLIHAWHDSAANQVGISVNGTADTSSWSSGSFNSTAPFRVGVQFAANYFDGMIDDLVFLKGYILDSTERTADYNSGTGVAFADWGGGSSGTGSVSAIASLSGVGKANKSGSGSVSAIASLSGVGSVVKSGSGSIAAVASIGGTGKSVRSGTGSITTIASLSGVGSAPALTPSGTGSISAIASLSGVGSVVTSGLGSISAAASISGIGKANHSGTGSISAVASLTGIGSVIASGSGSISAVASLSGIGYAPALSGPPINISAPVLTVTEGSWSIDFGIWNAQGLGPLSYSYILIHVDELNNSTPISSGSGLSGPGTSYSGTPGEFDNGRYFASVEAKNISLETNSELSNDFYLTPPNGSGTIVAIASLSGVGKTARSGLGSIAAIASVSGVGKTRKSGTGSVSAIASLTGVGRSSPGSPVIEYYYRYLLAT